MLKTQLTKQKISYAQLKLFYIIGTDGALLLATISVEKIVLGHKDYSALVA